MNATMPTAPADQRQAKADALVAAAQEVQAAQAALDEAVNRRNSLLVESHGDRASGGLSYKEMAEATGMSSGWVIQLVQGRSKFSQAQVVARQAAPIRKLDTPAKPPKAAKATPPKATPPKATPPKAAPAPPPAPAPAEPKAT